MAELPFAFQQELSALDLGEEAEASVASFARRHLRRMADLAEKAYEGEGPNFPICRLHPLGRLAVIVWKLAEIRRKYEDYGISAEIIRDTFSDIGILSAIFS